MNVMARIVGIVGVVLIVVALGLLFANVITINKLDAIASALRTNVTTNPSPSVMLTFGLGTIGGLLAGAGGALMLRRRN
ncbi:hypothetical protein [Deinococcus irradiatisoli]|nr:hypothetical protein [Deinococcus irradiatisoli]